MNYELINIVCYCNSKTYQEKAWEILLKQNPTEEDLNIIIGYASEHWRIKARALLKDISMQTNHI